MIREYWRLIALVLLIVVSLGAVFAPGFTLADEPVASDQTDEDIVESNTNLRFGLDLSGGTTVRAPLMGVTAEEVDVTRENRGELEQSVADELENISDTQVRANAEINTIEVLADVEEEEVRNALDRAGIEYEEVRVGVTEETRDQAISVLESTIDEAGFAGAEVFEASSATGDEYFIVVNVPQLDQGEVRDLITSEGRVELVAEYPIETEEGEVKQETEVAIGEEHIDRVGTPNDGSGTTGQPHVPVVLTDEGAERFTTTMIENGFTGEGVGACTGEPDIEGQHCLHTSLDDEVVHSASMGSDLASSIDSGDFERTGDFVITTTSFEEAQQLQVHLEAGSLPTELDIDSGTVQFVSPTLAENFKLYSVLTGVFAVIAVVFAVTLRYRDVRVSAPMIVTALSEVVILLGFIAFAGVTLDLAHIAGLIAVLGTGVDDLIIIADNIMKKETNQRKVFQKRFRQAFWIITAAAITTIIAMSPLAFLSLGDLSGFAIITILGVIIGVTITRPAYGDIVRFLVVDN